MQSIRASARSLWGKSVVEGSAETAYRAVALDADHALGCGEFHEILLLKLRIFGIHHEAYVHDGAVLFCHGAAEEFVTVDLVVEHCSLFEVAALHLLYTALLLVITQCHQRGVDGKYRRGVEHRTLLDVGAVVEHGEGMGRSTWPRASSLMMTMVTPEGARFFLRACVDALVFAYVELTAEDVGAHVAHHRNGES